ncbi:hypothetical protein GCM10019016_045270 [Streptomyces prasinosporus]|uniref:Uncharacterized protein n=1 Tax=Streptomyces prasinosporus TaxID=68256 RepID=A0ABP6TRR7_9ACTN
MFSSSRSPQAKASSASANGGDGVDVGRVPGRLGGGGAAPVVPVEAGFDDRGQDALGDGGVPAQRGLGGSPPGGVPPRGAPVRAPVGSGQFAGEVADQVVRHVAAVRRLLQQGHVDEPVQRGLGTALAGAGEAGQQGRAVPGQVERPDAAQGEGRVPVGLAPGGGERVVGDGQRAADAEVVVLQVGQPAVRGRQLPGERVRGEEPPRGEPGRDDPQGQGETAGEGDEGVAGAEVVTAGDRAQQGGAVLLGQRGEREPGGPVEDGER